MLPGFRIRFGIMCALLLLGSVGCSDKTGPAMVSGKVKYENHEFKNWFIFIVPKGPGAGMSARLEMDGSFQLPTRLDPNQPYVAYFGPPDETFEQNRGQVPDPPIPAKYLSHETTNLVIDVTPGKNAVEFELKP